MISNENIKEAYKIIKDFKGQFHNYTRKMLFYYSHISQISVVCHDIMLYKIMS